MNTILTSPRLGGAVRAPASKSEAHRLLIVAALAALYGEEPRARRVRCTDLNADIEATVRSLNALGADITRNGEDFVVKPIKVLPCKAFLDCGESGSTLRFLLPVVAALGATPAAPDGLSDEYDGFSAELIGHGRLPERPLSPLYEELVAHGARLSPMGSNPLTVRGHIAPGDYAVDGGVSSQFVSGLLFALPLLDGACRLEVTGRIESAPYIDMTTDALAQITDAVTGSRPHYEIHRKIHRAETAQNRGRTASQEVPNGANTEDEAALAVGGDWSGAAFYLTAGLLTPAGGSITVTGLDPHSRQGDRAIVDILRRMGGRIETDADGALTAYSSSLRGCEIDASQMPDLVPILAVAAAVAEGETRIFGAARLRLKESDRLATVSAMLTALGGDVTVTADGLIIRGTPLHGGTVDAAGDHRIAMAAAIAATRVERLCNGHSNGSCGETVTVCGSEAVAKSYPAFWADYDRLLVAGTIS